MKEVALSEIVRSGRFIIEGARAFQTNNNDEPSSCYHSANGLPLKVFQFSRERERWTKYMSWRDEELLDQYIEYAMVVVDEAHDLVDGAAKQIEGFTTIQADGSVKATAAIPPPRLLLSDISQVTTAGEVNVGSMKEVALSEIVRSGRFVVEGARAFQTNNNDGPSSCYHSANGLPLKVFQFSREREGWMKYMSWRDEELLDQLRTHLPRIEVYASKTVEALAHLAQQFSGLELHDRVAIIVPNNRFLRMFEPVLRSKLQEGDQGKEDGSKAFELVDAAEASQLISTASRSDEKRQKQCLVLDTVDNLNGLERLIVIAVGLDSPIDHRAIAHGSASRTRSILYRAITRAQMLVVVVNEIVPGGWLEFLTCVKFDRDAASDGDFEKHRAQSIAGKARYVLDEEARDAKSPLVALVAQIRAAGLAPELLVVAGLAVVAALLGGLAGGLRDLAGLAAPAAQAGLTELAGLAVLARLAGLAVLAVLAALAGLAVERAGLAGLAGLAVLAVLAALAVLARLAGLAGLAGLGASSAVLAALALLALLAVQARHTANRRTAAAAAASEPVPAIASCVWDTSSCSTDGCSTEAHELKFMPLHLSHDSE
jgi:hypothetical protein